ncbi:MAG: hypothetical protein ACRDRH_22140 [Pseudonocardia sp.]
MARRIGKRGKQVLDVAHYVTSVGWLGVGFCQLTLNILALSTTSPHLRHAAHQITHVFDRYVLIALALGSLITGVLLGMKTKWGLVRYWWVGVKLVLSLMLLVFAPIWMGGWIGEAVALTTDPAAPSDPAYRQVRDELLGGSISIVITLLLITVISVVKPWNRTWWGRRDRLGRNFVRHTRHRTPTRPVLHPRPRSPAPHHLGTAPTRPPTTTSPTAPTSRPDPPHQLPGATHDPHN